MRLERGVVERGKVPHGKNEAGDGKRLHGTGEPARGGQCVRLWRKSGLISQGGVPASSSGGMTRMRIRCCTM